MELTIQKSNRQIEVTLCTEKKAIEDYQNGRIIGHPDFDILRTFMAEHNLNWTAVRSVFLKGYFSAYHLTQKDLAF